MRNYVSEGNIVTFTATGAVVAGEPEMVGSGTDKLMVVPATSAATGEDYAAAVEGVFELAKESAAAFEQGDVVYWDDSNSNVDESASGRFPVGFAYKAAAATTTTCQVKLAAQPVTPVA